MTKLLVGLIGEGITQSLTPPMHEREASRMGLDYEYRVLDLHKLGRSANDIAAILRDVEVAGYSAVNITHPCKQLVIPLLDELSPEAARLDAVNLVLFRDGLRVGHNTDWTAFRSAVEVGLEGTARDLVVQFGAGGAGTATAYALLSLGVRSLVISDTDPIRARAVAEKYGGWFTTSRVSAAPLDDALHQIGRADGVVNATPVGMAHHPGVAFDIAALAPDAWVADIVYRPLQTDLLRRASAAGHRTLDGGLMAVGQAVDSLRLIADIEPDAALMRTHFLDLVGAEPVVERWH